MENHVYQIEFDGEGQIIASFVGEEDADAFAEWKYRQSKELHPTPILTDEGNWLGRRLFAAVCGNRISVKRLV